MGRRRSRSRSRSPRRSRDKHKSRRSRRSRSRSPKTSSTSSRKTPDPVPASTSLYSSLIETKPAMPKTTILTHPNATREGSINLSATDKEKEQKRLEDEMRRRKERVEKWRKERKLKKDVAATQQAVMNVVNQVKSRNWTLDDEDEDDPEQSVSKGDTAGGAKNGEDEIDPLDAFMQDLSSGKLKTEEDNSIPKKLPKKNPPPPPKSTQNMSLVLPNKLLPHRNISKRIAPAKLEEIREKLRIDGKGEVMEPNVDAMEYSSEEEDQAEETLQEALEKIKQKNDKLPKIDHSKMEYKPFKKDFYIEVPELSRMTRDQVKQLRAALENIRVRGKDCPKPVKTWVHCGVSAKILTCLKNQNFERPTPIQCQAIPAIMSGRDIIGIAKTGSGKTLAFLVPLMRHIEHQPPLESSDGPIGLLMAPTRELALQIFKEAKRLASVTGLRAVCVYGGTGISEQIAELKRGAEIIVCTPGRMIDMLAANAGRVTNLQRCTYVVLDEADRMFDLGFEPQVMRILENCRPDRQTVMFSATFPRQMEILARKALTNPIEIQVGGRSVVCSEVEQNVVLLTEDDKVLKLLELLGMFQSQGSILVFVEKQESADELMRVLMKYGYPCLSLHGGIDQYDRDSVIIDFKRGNIRLLIATSVAARGLDVSDLILVVNYDCPNHYEDYVHRCGRTGRAGRHGFAYTFITPDQERNAGDVVRAFKAAGQKVPEDLAAMWEAYKKRMEAEGKKVHLSSGFGGRGFAFDEAEAQLTNERKMIQKASLGLQDSDDEDVGMSKDGSVDWDAKIEGMFASKKKVTDVSKFAMVPVNNGETREQTEAASAALQLAKLKASQLSFNKTQEGSSLIGGMMKLRTNALASATKAGAANLSVSESKSLATQAAERLNAKLGYQKGMEEENAGSSMVDNTVKRYEEELDINDFPQNVRWRITSRETMKHLSEVCEVGVSVRGIYLPPGKVKQRAMAEGTATDERPLHLSLESTSERNIFMAKKEVTRIIKEELAKLQGCGSSINRGRYTVI